MLDLRPKGRGFKPHWRHCVVSLSKNIVQVLVQPRKTRPFITERLLMGCKESNQTKNNLINPNAVQVHAHRSPDKSAYCNITFLIMGAQWLSGRVLDLRPKGRGFKPHRRHCAVVLEQDTFILA